LEILERIRSYADHLKQELLAIYYAYQNPGTGILPKIIIFITLGYALSPIDLIPDFIPVLGYLDDLIIIPALISLSLKLIPKKIMDASREKAQKEPLPLKDKWFFAIFFILIWLVLFFILATTLYKNYRH